MNSLDQVYRMIVPYQSYHDMLKLLKLDVRYGGRKPFNSAILNDGKLKTMTEHNLRARGFTIGEGVLTADS